MLIDLQSEQFKYHISLDNITLVGRPTENALQNFYNKPSFLAKQKAHWTSPFGRYQYNFKFRDGSFLQMTDKSIENTKLAQRSDSLGASHHIRFEFNPNYAEWDIVNFVLKNLITPTLSRLDIAIDIFLHDLEKYFIVDNLSRKNRIYRGRSMNLETYYIGATKGENMIRIYNKALEQGLEDVDWWRIEGQLRGKHAREIINPFQHIKIFKPMDIHHIDLKVQEKALLYYIQRYPEHIGELTKNTRKKYFALLENLSEPLEVEPFEIFNNHEADLKRQIQDIVMLADNNILLGKEGLIFYD